MDRKIKIVLIVALVVVVAFAGILIYMRFFTYQFEIVSHNDVLNIESYYPTLRYNYTVFVEVKHLSGVTNTITLYCEITRQDLTKIAKQQTLTIPVGESKVTQFFFSNEDLKGTIPTQYRVYSA